MANLLGQATTGEAGAIKRRQSQFVLVLVLVLEIRDPGGSQATGASTPPVAPHGLGTPGAGFLSHAGTTRTAAFLTPAVCAWRRRKRALPE